jgi:hypothetical protein
MAFDYDEKMFDKKPKEKVEEPTEGDIAQYRRSLVSDGLRAYGYEGNFANLTGSQKADYILSTGEEFEEKLKRGDFLTYRDKAPSIVKTKDEELREASRPFIDNYARMQSQGDVNALFQAGDTQTLFQDGTDRYQLKMNEHGVGTTEDLFGGFDKLKEDYIDKVANQFMDNIDEFDKKQLEILANPNLSSKYKTMMFNKVMDRHLNQMDLNQNMTLLVEDLKSKSQETVKEYFGNNASTVLDNISSWHEKSGDLLRTEKMFQDNDRKGAERMQTARERGVVETLYKAPAATFLESTYGLVRNLKDNYGDRLYDDGFFDWLYEAHQDAMDAVGSSQTFTEDIGKFVKTGDSFWDQEWRWADDMDVVGGVESTTAMLGGTIIQSYVGTQAGALVGGAAGSFFGPAGTVVGGLIGGFIGGAISTFGGIMTEAVDRRIMNDGRVEYESGDYGLLVGGTLLGGALERIGMRSVLGVGSGVNMVTKEQAKNNFLQFSMGAVTMGAFVEGTTEYLQEGLTYSIQEAGTTKAMRHGFDWAELNTQALNGAVVGAASGGTIKILHGLSNRLKSDVDSFGEAFAKIDYEFTDNLEYSVMQNNYLLNFGLNPLSIVNHISYNLVGGGSSLFGTLFKRNNPVDSVVNTTYALKSSHPSTLKSVGKRIDNVRKSILDMKNKDKKESDADFVKEISVDELEAHFVKESSDIDNDIKKFKDILEKDGTGSETTAIRKQAKAEIKRLEDLKGINKYSQNFIKRLKNKDSFTGQAIDNYVNSNFSKSTLESEKKAFKRLQGVLKSNAIDQDLKDTLDSASFLESNGDFVEKLNVLKSNTKELIQELGSIEDIKEYVEKNKENDAKGFTKIQKLTDYFEGVHSKYSKYYNNGNTNIAIEKISELSNYLKGINESYKQANEIQSIFTNVFGDAKEVKLKDIFKKAFEDNDEKLYNELVNSVSNEIYNSLSDVEKATLKVDDIKKEIETYQFESTTNTIFGTTGFKVKNEGAFASNEWGYKVNILIADKLFNQAVTETLDNGGKSNSNSLKNRYLAGVMLDSLGAKETVINNSYKNAENKIDLKIADMIYQKIEIINTKVEDENSNTKTQIKALKEVRDKYVATKDVKDRDEFIRVLNEVIPVIQSDQDIGLKVIQSTKAEVEALTKLVAKNNITLNDVSSDEDVKNLFLDLDIQNTDTSDEIKVKINNMINTKKEELEKTANSELSFVDQLKIEKGNLTKGKDTKLGELLELDETDTSIADFQTQKATYDAFTDELGKISLKNEIQTQVFGANATLNEIDKLYVLYKENQLSKQEKKEAVDTVSYVKPIHKLVTQEEKWQRFSDLNSFVEEQYTKGVKVHEEVESKVEKTTEIKEESVKRLISKEVLQEDLKIGFKRLLLPSTMDSNNKGNLHFIETLGKRLRDNKTESYDILSLALDIIQAAGETSGFIDNNTWLGKALRDRGFYKAKGFWNIKAGHFENKVLGVSDIVANSTFEGLDKSAETNIDELVENMKVLQEELLAKSVKKSEKESGVDVDLDNDSVRTLVNKVNAIGRYFKGKAFNKVAIIDGKVNKNILTERVKELKQYIEDTTEEALTYHETTIERMNNFHAKVKEKKFDEVSFIDQMGDHHFIAQQVEEEVEKTVKSFITVIASGIRSSLDEKEYSADFIKKFNTIVGSKPGASGIDSLKMFLENLYNATDPSIKLEDAVKGLYLLQHPNADLDSENIMIKTRENIQAIKQYLLGGGKSSIVGKGKLFDTDNKLTNNRVFEYYDSVAIHVVASVYNRAKNDVKNNISGSKDEHKNFSITDGVFENENEFVNVAFAGRFMDVLEGALDSDKTDIKSAFDYMTPDMELKSVNIDNHYENAKRNLSGVTGDSKANYLAYMTTMLEEITDEETERFQSSILRTTSKPDKTDRHFSKEQKEATKDLLVRLITVSLDDTSFSELIKDVEVSLGEKSDSVVRLLNKFRNNVISSKEKFNNDELEIKLTTKSKNGKLFTKGKDGKQLEVDNIEEKVKTELKKGELLTTIQDLFSDNSLQGELALLVDSSNNSYLFKTSPDAYLSGSNRTLQLETSEDYNVSLNNEFDMITFKKEFLSNIYNQLVEEERIDKNIVKEADFIESFEDITTEDIENLLVMVVANIGGRDKGTHSIVEINDLFTAIGGDIDHIVKDYSVGAGNEVEIAKHITALLMSGIKPIEYGGANYTVVTERKQTLDSILLKLKEDATPEMSRLFSVKKVDNYVNHLINNSKFSDNTNTITVKSSGRSNKILTAVVNQSHENIVDNKNNFKKFFYEGILGVSEKSSKANELLEMFQKAFKLNNESEVMDFFHESYKNFGEAFKSRIEEEAQKTKKDNNENQLLANLLVDRNGDLQDGVVEIAYYSLLKVLIDKTSSSSISKVDAQQMTPSEIANAVESTILSGSGVFSMGEQFSATFFQELESNLGITLTRRQDRVSTAENYGNTYLVQSTDFFKELAVESKLIEVADINEESRKEIEQSIKTYSKNATSNQSDFKDSQAEGNSKTDFAAKSKKYYRFATDTVNGKIDVKEANKVFQTVNDENSLETALKKSAELSSTRSLRAFFDEEPTYGIQNLNQPSRKSVKAIKRSNSTLDNLTMQHRYADALGERYFSMHKDTLMLGKEVFELITGDTKSSRSSEDTARLKNLLGRLQDAGLVSFKSTDILFENGHTFEKIVLNTELFQQLQKIGEIYSDFMFNADFQRDGVRQIKERIKALTEEIADENTANAIKELKEVELKHIATQFGLTRDNLVKDNNNLKSELNKVKFDIKSIEKFSSQVSLLKLNTQYVMSQNGRFSVESQRLNLQNNKFLRSMFSTRGHSEFKVNLHTDKKFRKKTNSKYLGAFYTAADLGKSQFAHGSEVLGKLQLAYELGEFLLGKDFVKAGVEAYSRQKPDGENTFVNKLFNEEGQKELIDKAVKTLATKKFNANHPVLTILNNVLDTPSYTKVKNLLTKGIKLNEEGALNDEDKKLAEKLIEEHLGSVIFEFNAEHRGQGHVYFGDFVTYFRSHKVGLTDIEAYKLSLGDTKVINKLTNVKQPSNYDYFTDSDKFIANHVFYGRAMDEIDGAANGPAINAMMAVNKYLYKKMNTLEERSDFDQDYYKNINSEKYYNEVGGFGISNSFALIASGSNPPGWEGLLPTNDGLGANNYSRTAMAIYQAVSSLGYIESYLSNNNFIGGPNKLAMFKYSLVMLADSGLLNLFLNDKYFSKWGSSLDYFNVIEQLEKLGIKQDVDGKYELNKKTLGEVTGSDLTIKMNGLFSAMSKELHKGLTKVKGNSETHNLSSKQAIENFMDEINVQEDVDTFVNNYSVKKPSDSYELPGRLVQDVFSYDGSIPSFMVDFMGNKLSRKMLKYPVMTQGYNAADISTMGLHAKDVNGILSEMIAKIRTNDKKADENLKELRRFVENLSTYIDSVINEGSLEDHISLFQEVSIEGQHSFKDDLKTLKKDLENFGEELSKDIDENIEEALKNFEIQHINTESTMSKLIGYVEGSVLVNALNTQYNFRNVLNSAETFLARESSEILASVQFSKIKLSQFVGNIQDITSDQIEKNKTELKFIKQLVFGDKDFEVKEGAWLNQLNDQMAELFIEHYKKTKEYKEFKKTAGDSTEMLNNHIENKKKEFKDKLTNDLSSALSGIQSIDNLNAHDPGKQGTIAIDNYTKTVLTTLHSLGTTVMSTHATDGGIIGDMANILSKNFDLNIDHNFLEIYDALLISPIDGENANLGFNDQIGYMNFNARISLGSIVDEANSTFNETNKTDSLAELLVKTGILRRSSEKQYQINEDTYNRDMKLRELAGIIGSKIDSKKLLAEFKSIIKDSDKKYVVSLHDNITALLDEVLEDTSLNYHKTILNTIEGFLDNLGKATEKDKKGSSNFTENFNRLVNDLDKITLEKNDGDTVKKEQVSYYEYSQAYLKLSREGNKTSVPNILNAVQEAKEKKTGNTQSVSDKFKVGLTGRTSATTLPSLSDVSDLLQGYDGEGNVEIVFDAQFDGSHNFQFRSNDDWKKVFEQKALSSYELISEFFNMIEYASGKDLRAGEVLSFSQGYLTSKVNRGGTDVKNFADKFRAFLVEEGRESILTKQQLKDLNLSNGILLNDKNSLAVLNAVMTKAIDNPVYLKVFSKFVNSKDFNQASTLKENLVMKQISELKKQAENLNKYVSVDVTDFISKVSSTSANSDVESIKRMIASTKTQVVKVEDKYFLRNKEYSPDTSAKYQGKIKSAKLKNKYNYLRHKAIQKQVKDSQLYKSIDKVVNNNRVAIQEFTADMFKLKKDNIDRFDQNEVGIYANMVQYQQAGLFFNNLSNDTSNKSFYTDSHKEKLSSLSVTEESNKGLSARNILKESFNKKLNDMNENFFKKEELFSTSTSYDSLNSMLEFFKENAVKFYNTGKAKSFFTTEINTEVIKQKINDLKEILKDYEDTNVRFKVTYGYSDKGIQAITNYTSDVPEVHLINVPLEFMPDSEKNIVKLEDFLSSDHTDHNDVEKIKNELNADSKHGQLINNSKIFGDSLLASNIIEGTVENYYAGKLEKDTMYDRITKTIMSSVAKNNINAVVVLSLESSIRDFVEETVKPHIEDKEVEDFKDFKNSYSSSKPGASLITPAILDKGAVDTLLSDKIEELIKGMTVITDPKTGKLFKLMHSVDYFNQKLTLTTNNDVNIDSTHQLKRILIEEMTHATRNTSYLFSKDKNVNMRRLRTLHYMEKFIEHFESNDEVKQSDVYQAFIKNFKSQYYDKTHNATTLVMEFEAFMNALEKEALIYNNDIIRKDSYTEFFKAMKNFENSYKTDLSNLNITDKNDFSKLFARKYFVKSVDLSEDEFNNSRDTQIVNVTEDINAQKFYESLSSTAEKSSNTQMEDTLNESNRLSITDGVSFKDLMLISRIIREGKEDNTTFNSNSLSVMLMDKITEEGEDFNMSASKSGKKNLKELKDDLVNKKGEVKNKRDDLVKAYIDLFKMVDLGDLTVDEFLNTPVGESINSDLNNLLINYWEDNITLINIIDDPMLEEKYLNIIDNDLLTEEEVNLKIDEFIIMSEKIIESNSGEAKEKSKKQKEDILKLTKSVEDIVKDYKDTQKEVSELEDKINKEITLSFYLESQLNIGESFKRTVKNTTQGIKTFGVVEEMLGYTNIDLQSTLTQLNGKINFNNKLTNHVVNDTTEVLNNSLKSLFQSNIEFKTKQLFNISNNINLGRLRDIRLKDKSVSKTITKLKSDLQNPALVRDIETLAHFVTDTRKDSSLMKFSNLNQLISKYKLTGYNKSMVFQLFDLSTITFAELDSNEEVMLKDILVNSNKYKDILSVFEMSAVEEDRTGNFIENYINHKHSTYGDEVSIFTEESLKEHEQYGWTKIESVDDGIVIAKRWFLNESDVSGTLQKVAHHTALIDTKPIHVSKLDNFKGLEKYLVPTRFENGEAIEYRLMLPNSVFAKALSLNENNVVDNFIKSTVKTFESHYLTNVSKKFNKEVVDSIVHTGSSISEDSYIIASNSTPGIDLSSFTKIEPDDIKDNYTKQLLFSKGSNVYVKTSVKDSILGFEAFSLSESMMSEVPRFVKSIEKLWKGVVQFGLHNIITSIPMVAVNLVGVALASFIYSASLSPSFFKNFFYSGPKKLRKIKRIIDSEVKNFRKELLTKHKNGNIADAQDILISMINAKIKRDEGLKDIESFIPKSLIQSLLQDSIIQSVGGKNLFRDKVVDGVLATVLDKTHTSKILALATTPLGLVTLQSGKGKMFLDNMFGAKSTSKSILGELFATPESAVGQSIFGLMQTVDFMGRYSVYESAKGKITAQDKGISEDKKNRLAVQIANDIMIDYNKTMPRTAHTLNSYGLVPFASFFMRIQRTVAKLAYDSHIGDPNYRNISNEVKNGQYRQSIGTLMKNLEYSNLLKMGMVTGAIQGLESSYGLKSNSYDLVEASVPFNLLTDSLNLGLTGGFVSNPSSIGNALIPSYGNLMYEQMSGKDLSEIFIKYNKGFDNF